MSTKAGTHLRFLGFRFFLIPVSPAAEPPQAEIVSRTPTGEVVLRTLRSNGGVADDLPCVEDEILVRFKDRASPSKKAVQVWNITTGSSNVVVAVIGTVISLAAAVWLLAGPL